MMASITGYTSIMILAITKTIMSCYHIVTVSFILVAEERKMIMGADEWR